MNGMRQQPQASKKARAKQAEMDIKSLQLAVRLTQMMVKQMGETLERVNRDMDRAMSVINDLQYRTLAMLEQNPEQIPAVDAKADELKLKDYNESSDRDDDSKGYTKADVVEDDSVVIITSEAPDDRGIFRSKFKLSDCGFPDLVEALKGKKVGERATVNINGTQHDIELLGVRKPPIEVKTQPVPVPNTEAPTTVQ